MSVKEHPVFVIGVDGKPLTPTTWRKAKQLVQGGVAKRVWSKFNTPGIQMLVSTRTETPPASLGVDPGTKFEGYSVVVGNENPLNVKVDLPDKKPIVKKLKERSALRRNRRSRNCRRRPARFDNRSCKNFLAPSQRLIVQVRLRVMRELVRIYPICKAALENVCFNHAKKKWGKNFSTVEIGKKVIRQAFADLHITLHEYQGYETSEIRKRYGYKKCSDKSANRFESHCCDSLTLACFVQNDVPVVPGILKVVDTTYRFVRRKLHDTQCSQGGVRSDYSRGTVLGLRKGLLIGYKGVQYLLCGINKGRYRLNSLIDAKRPTVTKLDFVSSQFACS